MAVRETHAGVCLIPYLCKRPSMAGGAGASLSTPPLVCVRDLPPSCSLLQGAVLRRAPSIRVHVGGGRGGRGDASHSHWLVGDPVLCVQDCGEVMRSWQLVTHSRC